MATALKLKFYGDPCLRQPAKPVESIGASERLLIKELIRAMYEFDGAGLAAPQVGIDLQIFVADAQDGNGPFTVINPEFLKKSLKKTAMQEGCLSFPEIRIHIDRPETITVRYLDENGRSIQKELTGLLAKIFQHESDHLFGKMIIDYASPQEKEQYKNKLASLEQKNKKSNKGK